MSFHFCLYCATMSLSDALASANLEAPLLAELSKMKDKKKYDRWRTQNLEFCSNHQYPVVPASALRVLSYRRFEAPNPVGHATFEAGATCLNFYFSVYRHLPNAVRAQHLFSPLQRRSHREGKAPKQAPVFSFSQLMQFWAAPAASVLLRSKAMSVIAYYGALRASDLPLVTFNSLELSTCPVSKIDVTIDRVKSKPTERIYRFTIPSSETTVCPVSLVRAYLAVLFSSITPRYATLLSPTRSLTSLTSRS
eukprot:Rmarinus@m.10878